MDLNISLWCWKPTLSRSSPSARANHQRSFDVNWQLADLHHPRGWLQWRKQTARPVSEIDGESHVEVLHSFLPLHCFSSSPTASFSGASGHRQVTASMSGANGTSGGDVWVGQGYSGAGGRQKPEGALGWVFALRPLGRRAPPLGYGDARGRLPGGKPCSRNRVRETGPAVPGKAIVSMKGMADVLQP